MVALAGCGRCKHDAPPPPVEKKPKAPAVTTPAVRACLDRIRAVTEHTDRCEGGRAWWGSVERAVEQLRSACEIIAVAPGAAYDRASIDACIAALPKHACGAPLPASCGVHGSLQTGAPCAFGEQCGPGEYCKLGGDSLCGVCARLAPAGADCTEAQCEDGLNCAAGRCAKPRAEGEACLSDYECGRMMYCASTCQRLRGEGQPCTSVECAPDFVCDSGSCKRRPPPGPPGAPCKSSLDCLDFACVAGSCRELAGSGEPCESESDPPCSPSFVCFHGKCTLPDAHACAR